jgi:hypothetical protein
MQSGKRDRGRDATPRRRIALLKPKEVWVMPNSAIADVIRRCFAAYASQDRPLIESLIADQFSFSSPQDDHIDRAEYFRRCWPNSDQFRGITVEKIFTAGAGAENGGAGEDGARGGEEAFVQYVGETIEGKRFRNVERHRVKDGKLVEVDVYFGRTL